MSALPALLHERPRRPAPLISYLLTAMALIAAFLGLGGIAGAFGTPASAATLVPATADDGFASLAQRQAVLTAQAARAAAAPALVTVQAGQTLASIAQARCQAAADWTGIYAASRKLHLTARNANTLVTGQKLAIQCYANPGMTGRAWTPPPPPPAVQQAPVVQHATTVVSAAPVTRHYANHVTHNTRSASATTYRGSSGMEACIISRESGGNARAVNASSGAGGLFQFLPSTWASLGHSGLPENASAAEQYQAFSQEVAQDGGYSAWTPYDGC